MVKLRELAGREVIKPQDGTSAGGSPPTGYLHHVRDGVPGVARKAQYAMIGQAISSSMG